MIPACGTITLTHRGATVSKYRYSSLQDRSDKIIEWRCKYDVMMRREMELSILPGQQKFNKRIPKVKIIPTGAKRGTNQYCVKWRNGTISKKILIRNKAVLK